MIVLLLVCGVLGLIVGSFLNVVIWRVPRSESVVRPGSHCPGCGHEVLPRDNIPVLSWLILRGRCRHCGARISARYPLVEALTCGLFVAMAWRIGAHPSLVAYLYLAAIGVALALIDLDVKRLPDAITLPSYPVAAVLLAAAAVIGHSERHIASAAEAGAVLFAFYAVLWVVYPKGMGLGDVKLAGILGMYLGFIGWGALIAGAFLGFLYGGFAGVMLMGLGKAGRKSKIPYGPFMIAGALTAVFVGEALAHAYLGVARG